MQHLLHKWQIGPAQSKSTEVNVVGLQHAAEVGLVGGARAQALEGGVLVTEGLQEGIGELVPVKGLQRKSEMACSISTAFMRDF